MGETDQSLPTVLYVPSKYTAWDCLTREVGFCNISAMMEGPQPSCTDPNGWRLLINIDGVFIGMAVGLNYSEGSGRHMGLPLQSHS